VSRRRQHVHDPLYGCEPGSAGNANQHPRHNFVWPELATRYEVEVGEQLATHCWQALRSEVRFQPPIVVDGTESEPYERIWLEPPAEPVTHPSRRLGLEVVEFKLSDAA